MEPIEPAPALIIPATPVHSSHKKSIFFILFIFAVAAILLGWFWLSKTNTQPIQPIPLVQPTSAIPAKPTPTLIPNL